MNPSLVQALGVQLRERQAALDDGAAHVGWKIGGDIAEVDAVTGGAPAIGYLTTASLVAPGGSHDARGSRALRAETEVLIELAGDVAIAGVGAAIEIVDVARPPDTMASIVVGNVFHRAAVLGAARVAVLAPDAEARIWVNGALRERAPARVDVEAVVERVAHVLESVGERLRAGDRILAGALTHVPVAPGDEVRAEIEGVERLTVSVAGR